MKIPEGFTPRGDSNEQPPETYDKEVFILVERSFAEHAEIAFRANRLAWKVPDGPMRIIAYKVLP